MNPTPAAPTAASNSPLCVGDNLNLTASNITGATYNWTGPNSFSSTNQNPSLSNVTTAATGTYSVTATVAGCTGPAGTVAVTVNPIPAAPTAGSNSPLCEGNNLNLTASTITSASYNWTGPNGFTSTLQNPSISNVTTAEAGTYSVTATVAGCTGPAGTVAVTVNPTPAAPTAASNSPLCVGDNLNLTASNITGATYNWTGPNSFSSTNQNPSLSNVTTAATGTYSVTATVAGCTGPAGTVAVTVNPIPAAPTAGSNSPLCEGNNLNLTASTITSASYNWTGPNGFTSTLQNPSISNVTTAEAGTYSVTATVAGCTGSAGTVNVVVNPIPVAPTASYNSPLCEGDNLNLSASTITSATYSWTGPNGFTSTLQNPTISGVDVTDAGTYSVTATVAGCTGPAGTVAVVINSGPANPPVSSNTPVCEGDDIQLTAGFIAGASYSWSGPNGFTSTLQNPVITGSTSANAGVYSLLLTNGCSGTPVTTTVVVTPLPAAPTAGSNSPLCEGDNLNLTASVISGATYSWTGPNGFTSTTQNPSISNITTSGAGTYSVTATIAGCTGPAGTVNVVINPIPAAPTASYNNPLCEGDVLNLSASTITSASYSWTGPNGFTSTSQNPAISGVALTDAGIYSVTATVAGCTGPAGTVAVVINSGPSNPPVSSNTPVCEGDDIQLTAGFVAGASYSWSGPNGFTSTLQNPVITGSTSANAGVYSLLLTNGCSGTPVTTTVVIDPTPSAPVISGNDPVCEGYDINLLADPVIGATYNWTGPNGFSSTLQNPTISGATTLEAGTYNLTITTGGCTGPSSNLNINILSTPPAPTITSNSPLCEGDQLDLTATAAGGNTYAWTGPNAFSSTQQNPSIPGVTAAESGVYSVTSTNTTTGCVSFPGTVSVTVTGVPTSPGLSSNSPVCIGNDINLSATLVSGATYFWTGPNGFTSSLQNPVITNAQATDAGFYSVYITANGCTSNTETIEVFVNNGPVAPVATSNTPVCENDTLFLTAGVIPGAVYSWTGPAGFTSSLQNPFILNVTAANTGTYNVIADNGCASAPSSINVVVETSPVAPVVSNNSPICDGDDLNLFASTISGVTYSWTGPNGFSSSLEDPVISPASTLNDGVYTCTVTSTNGCASFATTTSIVNAIPTIPTTYNNSPICAGQTLELFVDTIPGATYSWIGPNGFTSSIQNPTIPNATVAAGGSYSVTVAIGGCSGKPGSAFVTVSPVPTVTAGSNSPLCEGNTINLTASTFGGATYSWTGPAGFTSSVQNPTITGSTVAMAGIYTVIPTAAGCTGTPSTVTVVINPYPAAPVITSNAPVCVGQDINFTTSPVSGTYNWTGPSGFTSSIQSPVISSSTTGNAGIYNLTVTVNGCTSPVGTLTVAVNTAPPVPTVTSNSPVCEGQDIELTASTSGGATYTWSGPAGFTSTQQNPIITNAQLTNDGDYTVVVDNGCSSAPVTVNVTVLDAPDAPIVSSNSPVCDGDDILLESNTVLGATYSWTGPDGFTSALEDPIISPSTLLQSGNYDLMITVAGCPSPSTSVSVLVNPIPDAPILGNNSPLCEGDDLLLDGETISGAIYSWTGPNGFSSSLEDPIISGTALTDAGTYTATVTVNGCESAAGTTDVDINPIPTAPVISSNSPLCEGDDLTLFTDPATIYQWSGPGGYTSAQQNPVINAVTTSESGIYSLAITEQGCTSPVSTLTVTIHTIPTAPVATAVSPICEGDDIQLSASATVGATYNWTGPNGFSSTLQNALITGATSSEAGLYSVTAEVNGCTSSAGQVNVVVNTAPSLPVVGSNSPICEGDDLELTATADAGVTFSWTGPSGFVSSTQNPVIVSGIPSNSGTYTLTVSNGCQSAPASTTVVVNPTPATPVLSSNSPLCEGDDLTLTENTMSGATYNWSGPGGFSSTLEDLTINGATATNAGTYNCTIEVNGCISPAGIISVVVNTLPPAPVATYTSPICENSDLFLFASTIPGATYVWSGPNGFTSSLQNPSIIAITSAGSGTYSVTAAVLGCTGASGTVDVTVEPQPVAPAVTSSSPICEGGTLNLSTTTSGGIDYSWSGPNGFTSSVQNPSISGITSIDAGTYSLVITDQSTGCSSPVSDMVVTVTPLPIPGSIISNSPLCVNQDITLGVGAISGATYNWTGPDGFSSNTQNPVINSAQITASGYYVINITANGCTGPSDSIQVIVNDVPVSPIASSNSPLCENDTLFLTADAGVGATYTWSGPGGYSSTLQEPIISLITIAESGTYTVTANNGCSSSPVDVSVTVNPSPAAPTVNGNTPVCAGDDLNLTASMVSGAGYNWSGPAGYISTAQNPVISAVTSANAGTYSVFTTEAGCSSLPVDILVAVTEPPVSSAGTNQTVCSNNSAVLLNGVISGGSGQGIWTSSGTGTFTPDAQTLNATYTPSASDAIAGTVSLTLTSQNHPGCSADISFIDITITPSPVVDAGTDISLCSNNAMALLSGMVTGGSTTGIWTTSGTGTFAPTDTDLNATYTASTADTTAGSLWLYLTSTGNGSCLAVMDSVQITFTSSPVADAGTDQFLCPGEPVNLAGNVTGAGGIWSSSGGGTFSPSTSDLNAIYQPDAADYTAGSVTLSLSTSGNTGCNEDTDNVTVTFTTPPAVDAGADGNVCSNITYALSGTVSGSSTTGIWTSTGDGSFVPSATDLNAEYIPGLNDISSGNVTITLTSTLSCEVTDDLTLTITQGPSADAGTDQIICATSSDITLTGTVSGITSTGIWSTTGDGIFTPSASDLNTVYTYGPADALAGTVEFVLTSTSNGVCPAETDTVIVTITDLPGVFAGNDAGYCSDNTMVLNGSYSGGATGAVWTTSGSGTFQPNNTDMSASYVPSVSDITAGSVVLTLTSTGACNVATDNVTLAISEAPIVNAGNDITSCDNATVALTAVLSGGASTIEWTSNGTGGFSLVNTDINVDFIPSMADISTGSVEIYLSSTNNGICNAAVDTVLITITALPIVDAGTDTTICSNTLISMYGTIGGGATGGTWSTSGSGTFSPAASDMNALYQPSAADIASGVVTLTLTSNGACVTASDDLLMTIVLGPMANAGADLIICQGDDAILSGSTGGSATGLLWSTAGTGTFAPSATDPIATYTPSAADISAGQVTLYLNSTGSGLCAETQDTLLVTITALPVIDAGIDTTICTANLINLYGTFGGGATGGVWSSSGTGTFSPSSTDLNAVYQPSAADETSGNVTLTLTSSGACVTTTDDLIMTFLQSPITDAGADDTLCSGASVTFTGNFSAAVTTYQWSTSGTGVFSPTDADNPVDYVPSAADVTSGIVEIYLTGTGTGQCPAVTDTLLLNILSPASVDAGIDQIVCTGSNAQLNGSITGGTGTGMWTTSGDGSFMISTSLNSDYIPGTNDLSTGTVELVLTTTNNAGCAPASDTVMITFTVSPLIFAGNDTVLCANNQLLPLNGSITGAGTTGYWATMGDGTFMLDSNLMVNEYLPGTTDSTLAMVTLLLYADATGGCVAAPDTLILSITPAPLVNAGPDQNICASGTGITLSGAISGGSSTGLWTTNGTGTFTPDDQTLNTVYNYTSADSTAGAITLWLTSTNNGGCLAVSDSLIVNFNSLPVVSLGNDTSVCGLDSIQFTGSYSGGGTLAWYTSDGTGLFSPDTSTVPVWYVPAIGDTALSAVTIILQYSNGCGVSEDTVLLQVNPIPQAGFVYSQGCDDYTLTFTDTSVVSEPATYNWDFGDGNIGTGTPVNNTYSAAGNYDVTFVVSSSEGCTDTTLINVPVIPLPEANIFADDTIVSVNQIIQFTDTSLYETSWHWDLGDGTGTAVSEDTSYAYATAGTYQVELIVYNALGCSDTAWQTIEVESDDDNTVFPPAFPTAFTPNNDGLNDVFYVRGGPFSEFELRIFNEWGNEIFISTDATVGWDGKFKDTQQPDGVYIYVFVGTTTDGSSYSIQGEINLVR